MGFLSLIRFVSRLLGTLRTGDLVAFVVCALLGFLFGALFPPGDWAVYGSMLIFYHLFLGWLVIGREQRVFSLPIVLTIFTHLALVGLVVAFGEGWKIIPFFGYLRYATAFLAIFERNWLFGGETANKIEVPVQAPVSAEAASAIGHATADDYEAWVQHLAHRNPLSRKPGTSVKDEFTQWMIDRAKSRGRAAIGRDPV